MVVRSGNWNRRINEAFAYFQAFLDDLNLPENQDSKGEYVGTPYSLLNKVLERAFPSNQAFERAFIAASRSHLGESRVQQREQVLAKALQMYHNAAPNNEKALVLAPFVNSAANPNGLILRELRELGFNLTSNQYGTARHHSETDAHLIRPRTGRLILMPLAPGEEGNNSQTTTTTTNSSTTNSGLGTNNNTSNNGIVNLLIESQNQAANNQAQPDETEEEEMQGAVLNTAPSQETTTTTTTTSSSATQQTTPQRPQERILHLPPTQLLHHFGKVRKKKYIYK